MNVKHTSYHIRFSTAKPRFHMVGDGDIAAKGRALGQETVFSGLLAAPEPSVELFAKNSARPVKPRFDSLGRASLDLRDLIVRHVLVFEQYQGFTKMGREP
jgi:hypothetical protein